MSPDFSELLAALRDAVGPAHVLTDPDLVAGHVVDWTGRFHGATPAVVRPGSAEEVAAVVRACAAAGAAIVPQGGNTGLVGGSIPSHDEIVCHLGRLIALGPVDGRRGQVTAQAGVTIGRLQEHARAAGWEYGIDLGARDSATVGGTIATNAGGVHVLRHGPTRAQLLGIEAVLGDGSVVRRLDGLEKDNTGYDLASLVCGSEGTLAIVTAARLRLVARPAHVVVALCAFAHVDAALDALGELRRHLDTLHAVELFLQEGLDLVCKSFALPPPFPSRHGAYLLVEVAGSLDPTEALGEVLQGLPSIDAVAVASDSIERRRALWRYRELHTDAINRIGPPHKLDVTLPADRLAEFIGIVRARVVAVAPDATVWLFGHAADGNVHVNVTGVEPDDDTVTDAVLTLVAGMHGSISAEHGIGAAKRRWMHLARSPAEIAAFRAIKRALDPNGVLNPHVLLPAPDDVPVVAHGAPDPR